MKRPPISGSPERFVSWWIQWSDLNWPNPDNFDAIRRRADLMAESNASTALVFGTHFRWDWLPYWEILHDYLATVADELHRRGLKLFDHHSTVLIHRYDTREEMRNVILHSQPHLPFSPSREAAATWTFRGRRLNDWRTVDTVTRRTLYYPQYAAEGFCHRNPEFMDSYREYVKKLLADTHVDGLMCDDAQHFMHYRSCACPVCLAAFRERAGIELPDADDATFWGNWDNPAWKMWIDLRYEATTEFQRAVRSVLPPDFPQAIYITFDVDGLDPSVIRATGTPVPGGPGWHDCLHFLERAATGRRIIGFDVVELAPQPGDHASDFAAAQLVYQLMGLTLRSGA